MSGMTTDKPSPWHPVSTHAMRRWMERVDGVETDPDTPDFFAVTYAAAAGQCDLVSVRDRVLTPLVRAIVSIGQGAVKAHSIRIVIRNHVVTTVLPVTDGRPLRFDDLEYAV